MVKNKIDTDQVYVTLLRTRIVIDTYQNFVGSSSNETPEKIDKLAEELKQALVYSNLMLEK